MCRGAESTRVRERASGEILEKVLLLVKFFDKLLRLTKFFGITRPPKIRRKISPVGEIFLFYGRFCTSGHKSYDACWKIKDESPKTIKDFVLEDKF